MKNGQLLIAFFLIVISFFGIFAQASTPVPIVNLSEYRHALNNPTTSQIVFDFKRNFFQTYASRAEREDIYNANYPRGDFYYFIGGLSNPWSQSDYERFYKVAKKLSEKGFRTIINVRSYIGDVQEAVANEHTSALIWNSHGSDDGVVYDSDQTALPKNIFTENRTARLKFVMFANCYGNASVLQYALDDAAGVRVKAWSGEIDSDLFFRYLNSKKFEDSLPQ